MKTFLLFFFVKGTKNKTVHRENGSYSGRVTAYRCRPHEGGNATDRPLKHLKKKLEDFATLLIDLRQPESKHVETLVADKKLSGKTL